MWRSVITAVLSIMVQLPSAALAQQAAPTMPAQTTSAPNSTAPNSSAPNSSAPVASAPVIPRGQGEHCIADRDTMRRNHMRMLLSYRHQVVRQGVHQSQHGIEDCVSCHAVKGEDGGPVGIDSPKHFCRVCHDYAAVRIDCFECHPSRP